MDADRYAERARREAELADAALERSRSAWVYAQSQESEGMRNHYTRVAAEARLAWRKHEDRARYYERLAQRQRSRAESGLKSLN